MPTEYERKFAVLPPSNSLMARIVSQNGVVKDIEDRYSRTGDSQIRARSYLSSMRLNSAQFGASEGGKKLQDQIEVCIKAGKYPARQEHSFQASENPLGTCPALKKTRWDWEEALGNAVLYLHIERINMHDGPLWIFEAEGDKAKVDALTLSNYSLFGVEIPEISNLDLYLIQYDFRALTVKRRMEYVKMRADLLALSLDCKAIVAP